MADICAIVEIQGKTGYFRVLAEDDDTLTISAAENRIVNKSQVRIPRCSNLLLSTLPWNKAISADDIPHLLATLNAFPDLGGEFRESQFYNVVLPTLDSYFGAKSKFPVEALRDYYQRLTRVIKTWLVGYEAGGDLERAKVVFHLVKKLFAAASGKGYGNGYRLGILLASNTPQEPSFVLSLANMLYGPIIDFLSRDDVETDVSFTLLDHLIPCSYPHFGDLTSKAITLTEKALQNPSSPYTTEFTNVLLQLYYNMGESPTRTLIFDFILQAFIAFLRTEDAPSHQRACVLLLPLLLHTSKALTAKFPLREITPCMAHFTAGFRGIFLESVLREATFQALSQLPLFPAFLRALCSVEALSHLFRHSKWKEADRLLELGYRLSHLNGDKREIVESVQIALSNVIPVQTLPLIDLFPVDRSWLSMYIFHAANRKEALEIVFFRAKSWYYSASLLDQFFEPKLVAILKRKISVFALIFSRSRSASPLSKLPKTVTFLVTEYL